MFYLLAFSADTEAPFALDKIMTRSLQYLPVPRNDVRRLLAVSQNKSVDHFQLRPDIDPVAQWKRYKIKSANSSWEASYRKRWTRRSVKYVKKYYVVVAKKDTKVASQLLIVPAEQAFELKQKGYKVVSEEVEEDPNIEEDSGVSLKQEREKEEGLIVSPDLTTPVM